MQEQIKELKKLLTKEKNIVITTHINPDGDAIGSSLALYHFLKRLKYNTCVITPNDHPNFLDWIPGCEQIIIYEKNNDYANKLINDSDIIFTLDFNNLVRCGELKEPINKSSADIIMIDHHQSPCDYAKINFSYPEASSTCELIFKLINSLNKKEIVDDKIASCIYLGMMTDTGCFQYNGVNSETHEILSFLISTGINHTEIYNNIYNSNNVSKLRILGCALNSLNIIKEKNTTYMSLSRKQLKKNKYKKGDSEGIVNYGLSLKGVDFTAIFIEDELDENNIKISFRSKRVFPCNIFAGKFFEGGGHKNAAGGRFTGKLNEAINKFKESLNLFKFK